MIEGLFIAIPTPGQIQIETALSLCGVVAHLAQRQIPHEVHYFSSADIVHSRNRLAAAFLAAPRCSHLLFIDGDIGFDSRVIDDLAAFGKDFTACDYPRRAIDFEAFRSAVEEDLGQDGKPRTATADLLARIASYTFRKTGFDGTPWPFALQGGFLSVPAVGMGLALISRQVFDKILAAGAADPVSPDPPRYPAQTSFGFFERVRDPAGMGFFSEDLSFCYRWVAQCGGQIWLRQDTPIRHIGDHQFSGNLDRHFAALPTKKPPSKH